MLVTATLDVCGQGVNDRQRLAVCGTAKAQCMLRNHADSRWATRLTTKRSIKGSSVACSMHYCTRKRVQCSMPDSMLLARQVAYQWRCQADLTQQFSDSRPSQRGRGTTASGSPSHQPAPAAHGERTASSAWTCREPTDGDSAPATASGSPRRQPSDTIFLRQLYGRSVGNVHGNAPAAEKGREATARRRMRCIPDE